MNRERTSSVQPPRGRGASLSYTGGGDGDDFVAQVERIKRTLGTVRNNLFKLNKFHKDSIAGGNLDKMSRSTNLYQAVVEETDRMMQDCRNELKMMRKVTQRMQKGTADRRMRQSQEKALATTLLKLAEDYQAAQSRVKQEQKDKLARQYKLARPGAPQHEVEAAVENGAGLQQNAVFTQQLLENESRELAQQTLRSVEARHEGIKQIEKSVVQLVELIEEMQFLIDSQQEQIDAIEHHVDMTASNMMKGSTHVGKAVDSRRAARKKQWIICALVVVLLIILGVLLYVFWIQPTFLAAKTAERVTGGGKSSPSPSPRRNTD